MIDSGPISHLALPVDRGGNNFASLQSRLVTASLVTASTLLLRLPIARDLLRFGELIRLELAGDVITLFFRRTSLFPGQLRGGQIAPHVTQHGIFGHALAFEIEPAEMELRARIALFRSEGVPLGRLRRV